MEAFETKDVEKNNFFALMFFVVALGNLVLYAICGWLCNIVAQVSNQFFIYTSYIVELTDML